MFKQLTYVPVSADSIPFAAAAEICRFDEIGYAEDEYFMSGTANIYAESESGKPETISSDAPYTTRLLVRRPKDITRFSGNVVLEILNATANVDIDRMWVNSWQFFTRQGDIYVGITSKGHVVDSLLSFDAKRYAPINWANPMPDRTPPSGSEDWGILSFLPQFESGLFWDMLTDCAKLLRDTNGLNPIRDYPNRHIFLTGWSQSGFYIARYLKNFYDPSSPLFDGYLSAGSWAICAPLNACEAPVKLSNGCMPQGSVMGGAEPVIAVNTESENRSVFWYGDFDEPDFKFRTYQIPACSHDTKYNLMGYCSPIGVFNRYSGVDGDPLDYPCEVIFNAAFYHLYAWARHGIPAPHAPKIETRMAFGRSTDPMGGYADNVRDVFGNAKGGIRTPAVDFPTGKYTSFSVNKDGVVNPMFGKVNPFPPELLKQLYDNLENYRALVTASAYDMIAKGFMLPEDKEAFIERVVVTAHERGLE
ncbi:MAG: hypothetical protein LBL96_03075 [Clostridiales bacterium]|jgi:hypothetical protein|nr:hypothetical protein [Clostridiales bacterium]